MSFHRRFLSRALISSLGVWGLMSSPLIAADDDLKPAAEVIALFAQQQGAAKTKQAVSAAAHIKAIQHFNTITEQGDDAEAEANAWFKAVNAVMLGRHQRQSLSEADGDILSTFAKTLPRPATWPHLLKLAAEPNKEAAAAKLADMFGFGNGGSNADPHTLLLASAMVLNEDQQGLKTLFTKLGAMDNEQNWQAKNIQQAILKHLANVANDADSMRWVIQRYADMIDSDEHNNYHFMRVPNVMARINDLELVDSLLLDLLQLKANGLRTDNSTGSATRKRLSQLLSKHRADIDTPHWSLISGTDSVDLYEATEKQFPTTGKQSRASWEKNRAFQYYIAGLLIAGDAAKAQGLIEERLQSNDPQSRVNFYELVSELDKAGRLNEAYTLFSTILRNGSFNNNLWGYLLDIAARSQKLADAGTLLEEILAHNADSDEALFAQVKLQLANGTIEPALDAFDRLLAKDGLSEDLRDDLDRQRTRLAVIFPDRYRMSLPTGDALIKIEWYRAQQIVRSAIDQQQWAGLQQFAVELIQTQLPTRQDGSNSIDEALQLLMRVALENNQLDDAIRYMQDAPYWTQTSLMDVHNRELLPAPLMAQLIDKLHGSDTAVSYLSHQMSRYPGEDAIYAELVQRLGDQALPIFAEQLQRAPFEELPLIWTAQQHVNAERYDQAIEACHKAIAMDPSDGEQGKDDRMRVYAILGQALAAKGDAKQAAFFEQVVASIRHSEDADDWRNAGLISKAIDMYAEGIEMFADAYCIQSRIAKELDAQGRWQEAEKHYQRAFELMPDSFGRMESHCFGCEGAFKGSAVQGVAEQVFTKRLSTDAANPRVHYLLGYLRMEQERWADAKRHFKKATELDPDYINAWKHLASVAHKMGLDAEAFAPINQAIVRIDPAQNHISLGDLSSGFAELWTIINEAEVIPAPIEPENILPVAKRQEKIATNGEAGQRLGLTMSVM